MTANWRDILVAWLHDPPDKALDIARHQARARRYAAAALGDQVSEAEMKDRSDSLAAVAERLPCPHWSVHRVDMEDGKLSIRHPLSGAERTIEVQAVEETRVLRAIENLVADVDATEARFLALWRMLPEVLGREAGPWLPQLPADTRVPDHSIWRHLDMTAGLKAAEAGDHHGAAFLSFSLGPVQPFIAAARSVRDLWSGSMLLAWITWQALNPVLEQLGPTAVVYPSLPGLPWLDRWLRNRKGLRRQVLPPDETLLSTPCLPNRFLAVVPWGPEGRAAHDLATACQHAARDAWREVAVSVHEQLDEHWKRLDANWDRWWNDQIEAYFDIRTAVLPWNLLRDDAQLGRLLAGDGGFSTAFPHADAVRGLADAIPAADRPGYEQQHAGRWQARVELSARLMQTLRNIRHIPPATAVASPDERLPAKCSLLGTYEQMGPGDRDAAAAFWDSARQFRKGGVGLRDGERLCAVSLVKRFCGPCYFAPELDLDYELLRYDDTATIAAARWLERAQIDPCQVRKQHRVPWSGQWLHWPTAAGPASRSEQKGDEETCPADVWRRITAARKPQSCGRPPAYYAVLMMDGDDMSSWLRGEKSPCVGQVLARQTRTYFAQLPDTAKGLDARRPVGPALHGAMSEALANFALYFARPIVEEHLGTLIYAGGDDVLALLPTSEALACAWKLSTTFRQDWARDATGQERMLMGSTATISGGLAVVHHKEDLRFALQAARDAEAAAKEGGKDALHIAVCRRSGEHASARCPWDYVDRLQKLVDAFLPTKNGRPGASDRWAYHLRQESEVLQQLPDDARRAEITRLVNRSEQETRKRLGETRRETPDGTSGVTAGAQITAAYAAYADLRTKSAAPTAAAADGPRAAVFRDFVTLCQTASFLARGREE